MFDMKVSDILKATGGKLLCGDENTIIRDICIDSREIKEGDLFVPIIGAKVDAHRFIESCLEVGAATLTSRHKDVVISAKPYIMVHDTKKALIDIGCYIRNRFDIPVIAVTGSVGKTTTREMISTALNENIPVYQTEKNYNSLIGTPITLSHMPEDTKLAVLELGIGDCGEMDILSGMVRPEIAVVTMIGVAHIEKLKTRENIRTEKLAITNGLEPDGVLFLNGDDPMLAGLRGKTKVRTLYYGTADWCDYRAENIHMVNYQYAYEYVHGSTRIPVTINALGRHNVGNSLAGMAITDYMGYDVKKAAAGFEKFHGMRQKLINIPGKYTIIDDTYNASPDSVRAAVDVLDELDSAGRKIAVFGDMFELGDDSEQYHYEIGKYMADKNINELVVVGELAQNIVRGVQDAGSGISCYSFKDNGEVALYLMSVMSPDDVALIKGSNGMHLNEIVSNLMG